MEFRIADTFSDSLAKLTNQEQRAVKTTAFDLQLDPASPGMKLHKLDRAKDSSFWSVRVSRDLRIIVHRSASSLMLCYVGHHDAAYRWAERRRIERHPRTGAAQLVELRERIEAAPAIPDVHAEIEPEVRPPLFAEVSDEDLLRFGVPSEWLAEVRRASEDSLFELAEHLPQEAAEALLDLATGTTPRPPPAVAAEADPFSHPDAQRRFRVLANLEELERALDFPWEKWTVFLHPDQRHFVARDYNGPARVFGSAGTGKTVVAAHRAIHLARQDPQACVLLTTFSKTLAAALQVKLDRLAGNEPEVAGRITVRAVTGIGYQLYSELFGQPNMASGSQIDSFLRAGTAEAGDGRFSERFLRGEWEEVVDAWQLESWEDYRDVARLGRKTRIGGRQREALWSIFARVRGELSSRSLVTWPGLFARLTRHILEESSAPFDYAVVDEAQDVSVAELRFLAALGRGRPEGLFFTGDLGQRIFQTAFSWKALGVDVRGRSHRLRVNYRTSHQIRSQADRLLPGSLADVDGNVESRRDTVSVFNGAPPEIRVVAGAEEEAAAVGTWIAKRLGEGIDPNEIGVFVRARALLGRARAAAKAAGAKAIELGDKVETSPGCLLLGTMHLAKGLEFRAVAVMACDDDVLPLQARIEAVADDADLEEVYNSERHLLYVACTRARDHLLVTGVEPASEFLDDMREGKPP